MVILATSDYWRIWFFLLESCGLAVQLASATQAKNLPSRPGTDKPDTMWLARLIELRAAAGLLGAIQGDPGPAGLHPDADPAGPGLVRGQQADHPLGAGHRWIRRARGHPLVLPRGHHRKGEELTAVSGQQVDHRLAIVLRASPVACVLGHRLCPQQPVPPAVLLQSC